jgi:hypothetical protein
MVGTNTTRPAVLIAARTPAMVSWICILELFNVRLRNGSLVMSSVAS